MASSADSSEQLAVLVRFEVQTYGSDVYHITTAEVCRFIQDKPDYYPGEYRHLYVRGQQDNHRDGDCYGYNVAFRALDDVILGTAERYYRVLKSVEGKLAKLADRFGPAYSYAEYLARVCDVLHIKTLVFESGKDWPRYYFTSIKDGITHVNYVQQEWAQANCTNCTKRIATL
jgi:hypothetical protein